MKLLLWVRGRHYVLAMQLESSLLKLEAGFFWAEAVSINNAALECRAAYQLPGFHDRRPGTRGLSDR
jgi:hypothetical protein